MAFKARKHLTSFGSSPNRYTQKAVTGPAFKSSKSRPLDSIHSSQRVADPFTVDRDSVDMTVPGLNMLHEELVFEDAVESQDPQRIIAHQEFDKSKCDRIKESRSFGLPQSPGSPRMRSDISDGPLPRNDILINILQTKIRSHVFDIFPLRIINVPQMKIMERHEVAEYIIRNKLNSFTGQTSRTVKDSFIDLSTAMYRHEINYCDEAISAFVKHLTKFAILSHIWGRDEPDYQSFLLGLDRTTSHGLEKLWKFCMIAHRVYGVEFAWTDTVCINKLRSLEHDESIRSLFSWYRESFVCIIYLADTDTLQDFPGDRWFTRGWNLQELLAPLRIKFYNKRWQPLTNLRNDKLDPYRKVHKDQSLDYASVLRGFNEKYSLQLELLGNGISNATGIPIHHIYNFQPGLRNPPFPERMKWLARRKTTMPEDMVYSMMGVLGVSIPIAYGEGIERAFYRLFRAVLKVDWSPSWFLWEGKPVQPNIHPSRMIPSSPTCYLSWDPACDPFKNILRPPRWDRRNTVKTESIVLTNAGLQIEVLVVPARVTRHVDNTKFSTNQGADITCPLSEDVVTMTVPHSDVKLPIDLKGQFTLGILDYDFAPQSGPRRIYAILLRRHYRKERLVGQETQSQHGEWKRCETEKIISFSLKDKFCAMTVDDWTKLEISRSEVGWEEDIVCSCEIEFRSLCL